MRLKRWTGRIFGETPRQGAIVLLTVVLALSACGGGGGADGGGVAAGGGGAAAGGGAGSGTSVPVTNPGPVTSGLLPAAPALGTTLEIDVARLRVLRAGATWRYTGVVREVGAAAKAYTNVVTHAAAAVGVTESASNPLNEGADSQPVRIEAGAVKVPLPLNNLGVARTIDVVELRAPVRVGDQITQLDERLADAVADVDGDGKREGLDIAVWTRVIGEETIDLLHRPGLRAVRVDTSAAVRLRPSAASSPAQPTLTFAQRNWYVAGVGLVRTETDSPRGDAQGSIDTVAEELESWDGLTEGLGALPPVAARLPGGGAALGAPLDAVAFSDHAVLLVANPSAAAGTADAVLASINLQGVVTAANPISVADSSSSFGPGDLLRVGAGLRLITRIVGATPGVVMTALGSDGQATGSTPVRLIDALPRPFLADGQRTIASASAGNRIWLMWMRAAEGAAPDAVFSVDLVLQGFAPDGTPVSLPRVLLAQVDSRSVQGFRVAANATQVLASWALTTADHPYAVFDAATGAELARRTTDALPPALLTSVPLALDSQLALGWQGNAAGIVRLDGAFNAVPTTLGDSQGDLLPTSTLLAVSGPRLSAQGDTVLLWGTQDNLREPISANTLTTLALMTMTAGPGPLAARPLTLHARLPVSGGLPLIAEGVLVFADRLLIYGRSNDNTLVTVPAWRRM